MNLFTTDHPITSEPGRLSRRARRWLVFAVFAYPGYLLLLGPIWAVDGRGYLDFIPEGARKVCYTPAGLVIAVPHLRGRYADYMDWCYLDPNAADRETGWE
jgi:hypothetical protein